MACSDVTFGDEKGERRERERGERERERQRGRERERAPSAVDPEAVPLRALGLARDSS